MEEMAISTYKPRVTKEGSLGTPLKNGARSLRVVTPSLLGKNLVGHKAANYSLLMES